MPIAMDVPVSEVAIVEMTNAFRKENALSEVKPNAQLAAAARAYAKTLAASGAFSHTVGGTNPAGRAAKAGYAYCQVAENLALLYDSRGFKARDFAKKTVEGWKDSAGHRKNMLAPHVTEIGVAIVRAPAKDPKYVSVQLFGRPRALQFEFDIKNASKTAVRYAFAGKKHLVKPRYTITHTSCQTGAIAFKTRGKLGAAARYEARDGQVYTLRPAKAGGVKVELGWRASAN